MLAMTCARCCLPTAADTLTFGLVVMVAAGTYQLLSRGLLSSITASCGSLSGALGGRRWGLWAAWRAAETVSCLALSIGDALLGLGVLLAAPWIVYRSGLLRYGKLQGCTCTAQACMDLQGAWLQCWALDAPYQL